MNELMNVSECKPCDASPSIVEMLKQKQLWLKAQLAETDEAVKVLEENPELMKVLHLVTKASRF